VNNGWAAGLSASNEFKAWLGRIRKLVHENKMEDIRGWKGLYQLKEFRERQSFYESDDKKIKPTMFLPNQVEAFQVIQPQISFFIFQTLKLVLINIHPFTR
jgi:hypothetical protein